MKSTPRRSFLKTTIATTAGVVLGRGLGVRGSNGSPGRVKIGQIGTGHAHAAGKMAAFRKLTDDYEVVGIAEPDAGLREKNRNHAAYKDLPWMTEDELLRTPGLEAVAVETEVLQLIPTAQRCVDAGMHLHLDKPAGTSLSAFRKLLDEATERGLTIQLGYMFRSNPAFRLTFKAAREGWLGEIFETHAVISKFIAPEQRAPWLAVPGGTMFELGCHLIDATVAVMGGKPEKVTPHIRRTWSDRDDLEDNMLAVLEYPKAVCTVRSSILEVDGGKRRQFVVCGDRGTADIRPLEPPVMQLALDQVREGYRRGYQEVELPAMPGRYDDQLAELARVIRGEIKNPYPPQHDLAVHETILLASGMVLD